MERERPGIVVASHRDGVAVFRSAPQGVSGQISTDGLRWRAESFESAIGPLHPLCACERNGAAELFCRDDRGRAWRVEIGKGRLTAADEVAPLHPTADWYEPTETPPEIAIVRDARHSLYRAFFTARRTSGRQPERRGCIGVATSGDLRAWNQEPPIYAPNAFARLHAPHVMTHEGRVALFYGTSEEGGRALRFALAPSLEGAFERPERDTLAFDAREAVQTVSLHARRLAFFARATAEGGMELTRPGQVDFHADGRPFVRFHDVLLGLLGKGLFQTEGTLQSGELLVRILPRLAGDFRLTARLRARDAAAMGLLFRTTMTGHDNVTLWLDIEAGAVLLRRGVNGRLLARTRRALHRDADYRLNLWVEGGFADIYLDDEWLLTAPLEGRRTGGFGLAVRGGEARFAEVTAQTIESPS